MDAAQIMMMPLVGAVPAGASDSAGMVLADPTLAEQFGQLLDDAMKTTDATVSLTPELLSDNQESISAPQSETSVLPASDPALQQMMSNVLHLFQPVQPQLQVETSQEPISSPVISAMDLPATTQIAQADSEVVAAGKSFPVQTAADAGTGAPMPEVLVAAPVAQPEVKALEQQLAPEARVTGLQVDVPVVQSRVDVSAQQQTKPDAQVVQPKVEVPEQQPTKPETQSVQPKLDVQVVQSKVEVPEQQPTKPETQSVQLKLDVQVVQSRVEVPEPQPIKPEAQSVQPKLDVQVVQSKVEVPEQQPTKPEAQSVQPKLDVQVVQSRVEVPEQQHLQPEAQAIPSKVEVLDVRPKVEVPEHWQPKQEVLVAQPKAEGQDSPDTPAEQVTPKHATEWWSYGRSAAAQHQSGVQGVVKSPDLNKSPVVVEKPASGELLQASSVQTAVAVTATGDAFSMDMGADSNSQSKNFSETIMQQHPLHVSASTQRNEGVTAEKTTENLRAALPEQLSRQVSDRLAAHDFKQGKENLSFTLNPEHLGKIQMNFQMDQQNLRVEIVAENKVVRDALMQQADALKESLARQNIAVEKFEVTANGGKEFQQQYQQPQQQQALYASMYDRNGMGRASASDPAGAGEDYQLPAGMQYFAQQYESTFTYRA